MAQARTTMLHIKVDTKLKKEAQAFAKRMGLPLSAIVNNYLKQLVVSRRVVFEEPLVPNEETAKILDEVLEDIKAGRKENFSPKFSTAEEAVAWLEKN